MRPVIFHFYLVQGYSVNILKKMKKKEDIGYLYGDMCIFALTILLDDFVKPFCLYRNENKRY